MNESPFQKATKNAEGAVFQHMSVAGDVREPSFSNGASKAQLIPQPAVQRFSGGTAQRLPEDAMLHLIQGFSTTTRRADIDISGAEFNFVRSIRVYDVEVIQRVIGRGEDCDRSGSVRLGSYGTQGDFGWANSSISELPQAHVGTERWGSHCPAVWHRSVFVEWRDYDGNYGFEQVNY